jgi:hypothetical protein
VPGPGRQGRRHQLPLVDGGPADLPRVLNPPAEPGLPDACKQRKISVPMTVIPKLRQREQWGTPPWVASFNRRSRVEASFGS